MVTSVKLDDDLKRRVQQLADKRDRSAHWVMREAIRDYVVREESRERFKQEALASWASYQQSGQHLSAEEMHEWFGGWGTEQETTVPKCHG